MKLLSPKTPWLAKKAFPSFVWNLLSDTKTIYLTFDDGPTPDVTENVLDILAQFKAQATFFCIGKNIEQHPTIFQRIVEEGHAIGNHTYEHEKGWITATQKYLNSVRKTQHTIEDIGSQNSPLDAKNSPLFRPPYGRIRPSQAKALQDLGYKIIMWDVLTFDWDADRTEKEILENAINHTKAGSILVFHDSVKASKNMLLVLPEVLKHFTQKGYQFKSINLNSTI